MEFRDYILQHEGDDLGRLALSRDRFRADVPDFDLALTTLESRRKLRLKVPQWYAIPSLQYPLRLSAEQCSSTETARYKASLAAAVASGTSRTPGASATAGTSAEAGTILSAKRAEKCQEDGPFFIADLTGGLGVDSWAFAEVADAVLYNEMNPLLSRAAKHNFPLLGAHNITVRNLKLEPGGLQNILQGFHPDLLFLDPARRASDGRKVFRLEDCQPDVLKLRDELLEVCPRMLLKLSPMADITLVCKQLGCVKEVHVVAAEGECKELLLVLEKGFQGSHRLVVCESGAVAEISGEDGNSGSGHGNSCGPRSSVPWSDVPETGSWLFEPGKALLKAGAFDWPYTAYGLRKLGRHTHLYISENAIPEALKPFGKCFRISQVEPLGKAGLKVFSKAFPAAEVSARNIPLTSDELRKKLGVRSGGGIHIFGVHVDAASAHFLLATTPA